MNLRHVLAASVALLALAPLARAQVLISDDFEADSSASYSVLDESNATSGDGTPDSVVTFAFDYVTAGIPLAPNSTAGDRSGLRMAVNETANDAGAADHVTAFHNLSVNAPIYTVSVDIYMGVEAAGGSTEMSTVGVGSDGTDFNSIFTPIAGDGHFLSMTGEGGSSSDFRHFVEGTPINDGDGSYLNSTNTTNATGDTYQTLFPSPPYEFAGSPGNAWTTLTIDVGPSRVTYSLDGTPIIRTPNLDSDGLVGLGYTDPFSSVGPHFVVFDNLSVTAVPEPATVLLGVIGLAGVAAMRRRIDC